MATYESHLGSVSKIRYEKKLELLFGQDPYKLNAKDWPINPSNVPQLNLWNIGNYLVNTTSTYTSEDFNAYKSLKAYDNYQCGWVRDVFFASLYGWSIIVGKVMHSQRLNEPLVNTWSIISKDGNVQSAHCTCMAGLGEACSHIAALLFYAEAEARRCAGQSVTDEPAYWKTPSALKKALMKEVSKINLKKRNHEVEKIIQPSKKISNVAPMSDDEFQDFLTELSKVETKPSYPIALLTVMPPFRSPHTTAERESIYPQPLRNFYKENLEGETLHKLRELTEEIFFDYKITEQQCLNIEKDTRLQANSKLWFQHRSGRVTASLMKRACSTKIDAPSISLIKQICYPERMKFITAATRWGCNHENFARKLYLEKEASKHVELKLRACGLIVNSRYPQFGATPDGIITCKCCGSGCLEIKCPYCLRHATPEEVEAAAPFFEKQDSESKLSQKHIYYYQVQMQLFLSQLQFCDFVVWTEKSLHIERIYPNESFWGENAKKACDFFKMVIFPEILGKAWTRPSSDQNTNPNVMCPSASAKKMPTIVHL